MNKYEGIFIIKPDLKEEDVKALLGSIEDEVKKNNGRFDEVKSWGRRRLAYSIKKFDEGLYYQIDFNVIPTALRGMQREFHLNDNILRFMIIKKEGK